MGSYPYTKLGFIRSGQEIPAAPVLKIAIMSPPWRSDGKIVERDAFIDTGSDITLIPLEVISQVEAKVIGISENLGGMGGGDIKGIPCYVGLRIDGNLLPLIRVYGCPREDVKDMVIIGRDVLNQYCIQFDGPKEILSFIDP